ncbi:hypothetical protein DFS34DRAFT_691418 [Phlyctochytrium arcticum]|nr:hypothetical protein DFS34DRAFT_691418 [Phlyctochytrium arcticum]
MRIKKTTDHLPEDWNCPICSENFGNRTYQFAWNHYISIHKKNSIITTAESDDQTAPPQTPPLGEHERPAEQQEPYVLPPPPPPRHPVSTDQEAEAFECKPYVSPPPPPPRHPVSTDQEAEAFECKPYVAPPPPPPRHPVSTDQEAEAFECKPYVAPPPPPPRHPVSTDQEAEAFECKPYVSPPPPPPRHPVSTDQEAEAFECKPYVAPPPPPPRHPVSTDQEAEAFECKPYVAPPPPPPRHPVSTDQEAEAFECEPYVAPPPPPPRHPVSTDQEAEAFECKPYVSPPPPPPRHPVSTDQEAEAFECKAARQMQEENTQDLPDNQEPLITDQDIADMTPQDATEAKDYSALVQPPPKLKPQQVDRFDFLLFETTGHISEANHRKLLQTRTGPPFLDFIYKHKNDNELPENFGNGTTFANMWDGSQWLEPFRRTADLLFPVYQKCKQEGTKVIFLHEILYEDGFLVYRYRLNEHFVWTTTLAEFSQGHRSSTSSPAVLPTCMYDSKEKGLFPNKNVIQMRIKKDLDRLIKGVPMYVKALGETAMVFSVVHGQQGDGPARTEVAGFKQIGGNTKSCCHVCTEKQTDMPKNIADGNRPPLRINLKAQALRIKRLIEVDKNLTSAASEGMVAGLAYYSVMHEYPGSRLEVQLFLGLLHMEAEGNIILHWDIFSCNALDQSADETVPNLSTVPIGEGLPKPGEAITAATAPHILQIYTFTIPSDSSGTASYFKGSKVLIRYQEITVGSLVADYSGLYWFVLETVLQSLPNGDYYAYGYSQQLELLGEDESMGILVYRCTANNSTLELREKFSHRCCFKEVQDNVIITFEEK